MQEPRGASPPSGALARQHAPFFFLRFLAMRWASLPRAHATLSRMSDQTPKPAHSQPKPAQPRTGRPSLCTQKRRAAICAAIRSGVMSERDCAESNGVDYMTFLRWMRQGESDPQEHPEWVKYRNFRKHVLRARRSGKNSLELIVRTAATKDWRAALEILARKHPDEWARKLDVGGKVEHAHAHEHRVALSPAAARELLAARLREIAPGDAPAADAPSLRALLAKPS